MKQNMSWLKEQMKERGFRLTLMIETAAIICLTAEFVLLSYGTLKITRYLVLLTALCFAAWIDQKEHRIPNKLLLLLLGIRGALLVLEWLIYPDLGLTILFSAGLGMLLGGGVFLIAYYISRGGVGMGDVKLFAVIGSYMGSGSIMSIVFLSVVISAGYSVVMLLRKKIRLKEAVPFAPFVLTGTILTMALGM